MAYYQINEEVIRKAYQDTLAILNAEAVNSWEEQMRLDSIKSVLWDQVQAAYDWAMKNKKDKRSKKFLNQLREKYGI